jgi:LPS export ABC transporter protein LptC
MQETIEKNGSRRSFGKQSFARRIRPLLLTTVVLLIVGKIVFLSPAQLEESQSPPKALEIGALVHPEKHTLANGIPTDRVPDYTIEQFTYVSTHSGQKEWNLVAEQAFLYNSLKLVHSKDVKALLYDTDGNITTVTGLEAKYRMNERDLEVFGNVETTLPDGFVIKSDYMRYRPREKNIQIPSQYPVAGDGEEQSGEHIHFTSQGMDFDTARSEIYLPSTVRFTVIRTQGGEQPTTVISDRCMIYRKKQLANFTMLPSRPDSTRFVEILQPTTWGKGRTADLRYGSAPDLLQYLTLHEDVSIKDLKKDPAKKSSGMKYATGGQADFDARKNVVILTNYPQVYQDDDTVTGDKIILYRDTDMIEVEHSNAFRQGS